MNYYYLIGTTIFFGILGGFVNAIREKIKSEDYWKAIIKGISASLLVPFFLFIIRSEIATNLEAEIYDYFIYGGFCLIASIFSDNFFDGIADRVLKKVENAEQIAIESNEKADALINKKAEPEEDTVKIEDKVKIVATDSHSNKILNALKSNKYEFRTLSGIVEETNLNKASVFAHLKRLEEMNVIKKVQSGKRNLWTLNE